MTDQTSKPKHHHHRHPHPEDAAFVRDVLTPSTPPGPTADCYRIAGYQDGRWARPNRGAICCCRILIRA